jgi:signal transduction histidine kinase
VGTVIAINLAGIVGIAMARRGVAETAARNLRLVTASRAHEIESRLASARADLAFLTGSPTFFGLEAALASRDPREERFRRLDAEGALLLFLRGHPEVTHLVARSAEGRPLVEAGRRGGVPVLWVGGLERAPDPRLSEHPAEGRPLTGVFAFTAGVRKVSGSVTLEATLAPAALLATRESPDEPERACLIADRDGVLLATQTATPGPDPTGPASPGSGSPGSGSRGPISPGALSASAAIQTDGWSAPSPWRLVCARRGEAGLGPIDPIAARYRTTLLLNLAVMSLALLLGAFALRESRRRSSLEADALESVRVRELERRLFHAERLSTVGRLAAGMAHEINNPLEGMSNYLSLAKDDLARADAPSALRRLDGVQEGLQRAVGIVRQVLAHADPATAPKAPLDLNAAVRQAAEFVGTRPEFTAIRFDLALSAGGLMVRGNQTLLGQVFLNLLLNACEAQPRDGEVRVASRLEGARAVVEIGDRGPGVPPRDAARIFEPFYSTKDSTGLGLSICHSIVADHGGTLEATNRQGGGAVFVLRLPAETADA